VPTPGYSGHSSIFAKPISYLNKDKIMNDHETPTEINQEANDELPDSFKNIIQQDNQESSEVIHNKYFIFLVAIYCWLSWT
jgi:hypothetical protein